MRIAFAVFLFVHGFAHIVGFLTTTGIVKDENTSPVPSLVLSDLDPKGWPLRLFGVVWLLTAFGFAVAGIGVLQEAAWAVTAVIVATAVSTVLSLIWLKEAPLGIAANVVIVAALVVPAIRDRVIPG
jgi:hypothetical protein